MSVLLIKSLGLASFRGGLTLGPCPQAMGQARTLLLSSPADVDLPLLLMAELTCGSVSFILPDGRPANESVDCQADWVPHCPSVDDQAHTRRGRALSVQRDSPPPLGRPLLASFQSHPKPHPTHPSSSDQSPPPLQCRSVLPTLRLLYMGRPSSEDPSQRP